MRRGALDRDITRERIATRLPAGVATIDSVMDAATLPASAASAMTATASYSGKVVAAGGDDAGDYSFQGDLGMRANFDTTALTGTITNLIGYDEQDAATTPYDGSATISGNVRNGGVTATVTGEVGDFTAGERWAVSGVMTGEVRGANAETMVGSLELLVDDDEMGGVWVADKTGP